jgi:hypothetical protein
VAVLAELIESSVGLHLRALPAELGIAHQGQHEKQPVRAQLQRAPTLR